MKLLFDNINIAYAGFDQYLPILVGNKWLGISKVDEALGKKLSKESGVTVLSDDDFEWYKKKVHDESVTFRKFATVKQEASKDPLADYVEEVKSEPEKKNPKDLMRVEAEDVEPEKPKKSKSK